MHDQRRQEIESFAAELQRSTEAREQAVAALERARAALVDDVQATFGTPSGQRVLTFLVRSYITAAPSLEDILATPDADGRPPTNEAAMNTFREALGARRVVQGILNAMQGKVAFRP